MEVRTEKLIADAIEAPVGADIDLQNASAFVLPHYTTATLPVGATDGTLVWDTTDQTIKVSAAGMWLPVAIIT